MLLAPDQLGVDVVPGAQVCWVEQLLGGLLEDGPYLLGLLGEVPASSMLPGYL